MVISSLKSQLYKVIDVAYLMRFLILLLVLYYGNLAFIAVIDTNGRVYSSLLNDHFNYISWIRNSYLYAANAIAHLIGLPSHVTLPYRLTTTRGSYVEMVYECLGLGLLSFWTAFVWPNKGAVKNKLKWWLTGLFFIWFINCCRIAILLLAIENRWPYNAHIDHHTLFNYVAYILIAILIIFFMKSEKRNLVQPTQAI